MEVKDTVMSSQVRDHFSKKPSQYTYEEISNLMMESRKAGIKEVVEWIEKEFGGYIPDFKGGLVLKEILIGNEYGEVGSFEKWQAKLKEWGLSNGPKNG